MDITLEDDDFRRAFDRFKELADRKGEISEEGIRAIVAEKAGVVADTVELVGIHFSGGNQEVPVAAVTVRRNGDVLEVSSEGDGMVNAAFAALQQVFGIEAELLDYRVSPLTSGADAMAEVSVIIQIGSVTFSGRGVSTDVVEGSARAFTAALNKAAVDRSVVTPHKETQ
jgi:2-isopropylmalate synthase